MGKSVKEFVRLLIALTVTESFRIYHTSPKLGISIIYDKFSGASKIASVTRIKSSFRHSFKVKEHLSQSVT